VEAGRRVSCSELVPLLLERSHVVAGIDARHLPVCLAARASAAHATAASAPRDRIVTGFDQAHK
jgi:hypothetical protein